MSIDYKIIRDCVIKPVLEKMNMHSKSAENLLLGTAAVESDMFHYSRQVNGPAISGYCIEPSTYDDITKRYLEERKPLKELTLTACGINSKDDFPDVYHMIQNHWLATAICRLKYYMHPQPLPRHDDIGGLARYWKLHYNTVEGKGTVKDFIEKFERYVGRT